MEWKKEIRILFWIIAFFLFAYFMPVYSDRFREAIMAMLDLTKW